VAIAAILIGGGIAWAASITLTSKHLGAASVSTPVLFPVSVTTANVGPNVGKIDKNDTITFVWSEVIDQPTLCSGWANSGSTHTLNMTWVINDNTGTTGNDVMAPSTTGATCSTGMHVGTVDLGSPGYITNGTATFANTPTTVTVGATTTTLTVKIPGAPTGGKVGAIVTTGSAAVWTPDTAVTDLAGHNSGNNLAQSSATVQF
jgi:hypothetical protein